MKYKQPHIVLRSVETGLEIIVDDREIFDYIEDYLTEKYSIAYDYMTLSDKDSQYVMQFSDTYDFEQLQRAIAKLDVDEIEKIYSLYNSIQGTTKPKPH